MHSISSLIFKLQCTLSTTTVINRPSLILPPVHMKRAHFCFAKTKSILNKYFKIFNQAQLRHIQKSHCTRIQISQLYTTIYKINIHASPTPNARVRQLVVVISSLKTYQEIHLKQNTPNYLYGLGRIAGEG